MKRTKFIITLLLLTLAIPLAAQQKEKRTIIIRDGKIMGDFDELRGKRAYLGVTLVDLTAELRDHFGGSRDSGVMVGAVESGSPADKAGLRVGDMIVSLDGKSIDSSWDLRAMLAGRKEGDAARIDYVRGKNRATTVATLVEREGMKVIGPDFEELGRTLSERFSSPEWKARMEQMPNCGELQSRLRDLEARLRELESKLQK